MMALGRFEIKKGSYFPLSLLTVEEIFEHLKEFKITTSHFEINHLISCKFSQLEEIEKLIKKENGF